MKSYKLLIFAIIFSALCLSKRLGSKSRVAKLEDAEKTPQVCKCIKSEGSEMYELLGVTGYLLYKTKEKCDEDVKLICAWYTENSLRLIITFVQVSKLAMK